MFDLQRPPSSQIGRGQEQVQRRPSALKQAVPQLREMMIITPKSESVAVMAVSSGYRNRRETVREEHCFVVKNRGNGCAQWLRVRAKL